jgi:carbamate kinase
VSTAAERARLEDAGRVLASLLPRHRLVVTHGNGPQVGALATATVDPLEILNAESAGALGFLIAEAIDASGGAPTVVMLTRVLVAHDDPGFRHPTKPIGRSGRLVASPDPMEIVELESIRSLVHAGMTVVCGGGGGIPVARDDTGVLRGVEAVIDKDLTASRLACDLDATEFIVLTDVDGVHDGWPGGDLIRSATPRGLRALSFQAGTMGPKVEACCRFVEHTGRRAVIGALSDGAAVVAGQAGTIVMPSA